MENNQTEKTWKDLAAICYVPLVGQMVYLGRRKEHELVAFHGVQGFILTLVGGVFWYFLPEYFYAEVVLLPFLLIGIVNAEQGKMVDVPVFGQLRKLSFWSGLKNKTVTLLKSRLPKKEEKITVLRDEKLPTGVLRTHEEVPQTKPAPKNLDF